MTRPAFPQTPLAFGRTDAVGAYRVANVSPGEYLVRFDLPGSTMSQFHPQRTDPAAATVITVLSGLDTVVDESVVPHGGLAGRLTFDDGTPVPNGVVGVERLDGAPVGSGTTDAAGDYRVPFLPAGAYRVYFHQNRGGSMQWAHQRRSRQQADPVHVAVGSVTTLDERLLPMGTIAGRLFGRSGPFTEANVVVHSQDDPDELNVAVGLHGDGSFEVPVFPGRYKVSFQVFNGTEQWVRGQSSPETAEVFPVAVGQTVLIEEFLVPVGRMRGRLTDAGGAPVADAVVRLQNAAGEASDVAFTDADGRWVVYPAAGTYRVEFTAPDQAQWAFDEVTRADADLITVGPGQTVTVDESLLPTGSLVVRARDARRGTPITSFCATAVNEVLFRQACTDDGSVEFPTIGAGVYTVTVSDGIRLDTDLAGVRVRPGKPTKVTARLTRGATVVLDTVDARTGAPVDDVCVNLMPANGPHIPRENHGGCSENGTIVVDRVRLGSYAIFASTLDGVHGSQWVGWHGGVGSQERARVVTATSGATVRLTVRLDGRGAIGGLLTDQATGAPVANALISVWGTTAGSGADGRYVLEGLGPYEWTVMFRHPSYGAQWSGGGTNRLTAEKIRVRTDETTPYDFALRRGTTLAGQVTGPGGARPTSGVVTVYHAHTFDAMAHINLRSDGTYSVPVVGPQDVILYVETGFGGRPMARWYDNVTDFHRARTVRIPSSGTTTVDIALG